MLTIGRWIRLTPAGAVRDGEPVRLEPSDDPLLVALYRRYAGGYPKFFKMDPLCRLGFVASELLLDGLHPTPEGHRLMARRLSAQLKRQG